MANIMLLHGSFHGAWCWRPVESLLRAQGHRVHCPTLSGCAERFHHAAADVTLETHVEDVLQGLFQEDLREVVLVGHSYAGLVVQAAAHRDASRLAGLYFLDAYVVDEGQCGLDLWSEERRQEALQAIADGHPFRPPFDPALFELEDADRVAWVRARLTPHPLRTYQSRLPAQTPRAAELPKRYVHCTRGFTVPMFAPLVDGARRRGWPIEALDAPHAAMLTHPQAVAASVDAFARSIVD
jgi:pimeloyl-ACP methyl ester carboxylesterase